MMCAKKVRAVEQMNYDNKKECVLCDYWRIYTTGSHNCSLEDGNCPYDKSKESSGVNDD